MPYVSVNTSMPVCEAKLDTLQKEIGRIITLIPGKTIDNCMTHIAGGAHIYMSGAPAKAVFCEIRVFKPAPREGKAGVVAALHALFTQELGAEKVYINFIESEEWGSGPNYMG